MSAGELRVGVLGTGRIGTMHAELLHRRVAGARVTRVHDLHEPAARALASALGGGVTVAESSDELLAAADVDAVAICTSTDTHVGLIVAAAQAGKAIFCEKPISLDLAEMDAALAAVEQAGVPFQIGFNRRFDPAHASVRQAVADGTIGEPQIVRISSRDPEPPPLDYVRGSGGIFLDMTIHDFDMARFVTGSEVVSVSAQGALRIRPEFAEAGDVDTAVVTLEHANGCLTTIDNSRQASYGYDQRVEVHGSRGMAASEDPRAHTGIVRTAAGEHAPSLPHFFIDRYTAAYLAQWQAFVSAVSDGRTPAVTAADGRAPLAIGLAAGRSLRERRPVAIAEIEDEHRAAIGGAA
ncbi:inositol 2-dehydrogenase [Conexibacter sp. JD483]|uniref:inositol 2-dehydrogenase n=1 Tax=unclassified Conexibacter TaxID=2627773 RepID=UPI002728D820|nr:MULTISPECIES: inositol 2-dehydrogenase [unclassified Conexibacter]MDO8184299.1 inositol 2-dehydrogenase [Conexibacter sp. CPCC 205706]MDO8197605.1 inositol 2-dehydrogenase [Conexibacter sp. CPCC 205762]MDR9369598.1 inositol 2-dehydrogenase [Conexibacter sp. JD483]